MDTLPQDTARLVSLVDEKSQEVAAKILEKSKAAFFLHWPAFSSNNDDSTGALIVVVTPVAGFLFGFFMYSSGIGLGWSILAGIGFMAAPFAGAAVIVCVGCGLAVAVSEPFRLIWLKRQKEIEQKLEDLEGALKSNNPQRQLENWEKLSESLRLELMQKLADQTT